MASLRTFFTWLGSFFGKAPVAKPSQIPGLPPGVRLATMDEADFSRAESRRLPVVSILTQHGAKSPYPPELEGALWGEYKKAYECFEHDYSCGVAVRIIRGFTECYEPLDILTKVSVQLVKFLEVRGVTP